MKYTIPALTLLAFTIIAVPVFSQSPTSTPSASLSDEVDKLKEKVAEKVEELKREEKATAGVVTAIDGNRLTLRNPDGSNSAIAIDETLTDFFEIAGTKTSDLNKDDIEVGNYLFVTGPEIGDAITANVIYRDTSYFVSSGKITEVNGEDFSIRVLTVDKSQYVLDIEKKTDQKILDIQTLETEKIGFTKLKEGDSVHFVVKVNPEDPKQSKFSAARIVVVPNEYFLQ
ncbi:hypothetical protein KBD81_06430 [Candidatus Woesebacteria bacterium]|nr:hypothetical protein [Candidatus Woesebacteria bacterium]